MIAGTSVETLIESLTDAKSKPLQFVLAIGWLAGVLTFCAIAVFHIPSDPVVLQGLEGFIGLNTIGLAAVQVMQTGSNAVVARSAVNQGLVQPSPGAPAANGGTVPVVPPVPIPPTPAPVVNTGAAGDGSSGQDNGGKI